MDTFDLRKFLTENKLTSVARLQTPQPVQEQLPTPDNAEVEIFVEEHPDDYMYVVFDLRDNIAPPTLYSELQSQEFARLEQITKEAAIQAIEEYQNQRERETPPNTDVLGSVQALLPDNYSPGQIDRVLQALIQICEQMQMDHKVDDPETRILDQPWVVRKKSSKVPKFTPKKMLGGVEVLITPGFLV